MYPAIFNQELSELPLKQKRPTQPELSVIYPCYLLIDERGKIVAAGPGLDPMRLGPDAGFFQHFEIPGFAPDASHRYFNIPTAVTVRVAPRQHMQGLVLEGVFQLIDATGQLFYSGVCKRVDDEFFPTYRHSGRDGDVLEKTIESITNGKLQEIGKLVALLRDNQSTEVRILNNEYALTVSAAAGNIIWCNSNFISLTGYSREDIIGTRTRDRMYGPRSVYVDKNFVDEQLKTGKPFYFENIGYSRTGREYWFGVTVYPVISTAGEMVGRLHCIKDITRPKLQKLVQNEHEQLLQMAIESTDMTVWYYDVFTHNVHYHPNAHARYHEESLRVIAAHILQAIHKASVCRDEPGFTLYNQKVKLSDTDGRYRHLDISFKCIEWDTNGGVVKYVGTFNDVTIQNEHYQELHHKNLELQKINTDLEKFLYSTSHNLRSPLLSVKGVIELMQTEQVSDMQQKEFFRMMISALNTLDNTVLDMHEYSNSSMLELIETEIDLEHLIHRIYHEMRFLQKNRFSMNLEVKGNVPFRSDEKRITSIITNIISNALKYSDSGKPHRYLDIKVSVTPQRCTLIFSDNGIGIPTNLQSKIFDLYFRATNQATGTGLGMSIVKEMLNKLGGTIRLTSTEGEGTTVYVTIPNGCG